MIIFASALLAALMPVVADKSSHSVTFTARATEIAAGTTVEFAFVGPESDRAYEAMFITDASVAEIAKAFDDAGIPRGKAISQSACRFWPAGCVVTIEPDLSQFIDGTADGFKCPVVYTGGRRDTSGLPVANTNMPEAIFAMYGLDQSLLLFDNTLDQSTVYGRYTCRRKLPPGERHTFKLSWNGKEHVEFRDIVLAPGKIHEVISSLKGSSRPLDIRPIFPAELTVKEARSAAKALSVIDSEKIRINGFVAGQMFYQGFLPDEKWRDRQKRLTQPLEVTVAATNVVCTIIDEDWSVEGDDPKLTPHAESIDDVLRKFKGDTCIFFVSADEKLARIYSIMGRLPRNIRNWYVFVN